MTQAGGPGAARAPGPSCDYVCRGHPGFDKEQAMAQDIVRTLTRTRAGYLQFVVGATINVAGAAAFLLHVADYARTWGNY